MTARKPQLADEVVRRLWPQPHEHATDPVGWINGRLGAQMWSGQEAIARALVKHRHVAVQSAHGCGKDWEAARLVAWWVETQPDPFVVSTAPTSAQLSGVLWRELSRAHKRAELPGTISTGQIPTWRLGNELVAWGRKPADLSDPEEAASAFQGIHARSVLVILDEASGIPDWLWTAAESLMTSEASRALAIGNPLDPSSRFAKVCAPGSEWEVLRFSVFDTPAFTGERVPQALLDVLPSKLWVEERRKDWGEGSPMWISRVLGEFPPVGRDTLIAPHLIRQAQECEAPANGTPRLGVDVARSGADRSVVAAFWPTGRLRVVHEAAGADTMQTSGAVLRLLREDFGPPEQHETSAAVDVIGLGAGVFDRLREQGARVTAFNSSSRPRDPVRFANRRAEVFWHLRELLEAGELDLDPDDLELAAQLGALRWRVDSSGRVLIESKDAIRARGLPSPDRADASAMACARAPAVGVWRAPEPHPLLAALDSGGAGRRLGLWKGAYNGWSEIDEVVGGDGPDLGDDNLMNVRW